MRFTHPVHIRVREQGTVQRDESAGGPEREEVVKVHRRKETKDKRTKHRSQI